MARPRMKAGHLLAGEGIQVAANPLDRLGNLFGRALLRALEQQMLDEMTDAVELRWFVARPHSDPQANAHTQHVRHLRRGDCQTVLELGDVIHSLPKPNGQARTIQHPAPRIQSLVTLPASLYLACTSHVPGLRAPTPSNTTDERR